MLMKNKKDISVLVSEIEEAERTTCNSKKKLELKAKLRNYSIKIYEIAKGYEDIPSFIEPQGIKGRNFDEEIDFYLIDQKNEGNYQPEFVCPKLHTIDLKELKRKIIELRHIEQTVAEEKNRNLKNIILNTIDVIRAKINILIELKNGNTKEAFGYAKIAYGDIDDDLVKMAENNYNDRIRFLKNRKRKSRIESILEKKEFFAEDIKYFFDMALDEIDLIKKVKVLISKNAKNINFCYDSLHDSHVIIVPTSRRVNGIKLFELIAHEIGIHALVNISSEESGFSNLNFGRYSEALQEGFAVRNEIEIKKKMLGGLYKDVGIKSKPYAILAMQKIKEGSGIRGVYNYIFDLRKKEYLTEGYNKLESEEKSSKTTKDVLRRVYRGFYPYYFPKDKIYFEGEFLAKRMKKEKKGTYFLQSRVDPYLLPSMIKIGFYSDSIDVIENINNARKVALIMWKEYNLLK